MSDFDIFDYATKWYVLAPALIVLYAVYKKVNEAYLRKKLGAAKEANCESDGAFGFRLPFWLIQWKKEGTIIDNATDRYADITNPNVPTLSLKIFGVKLWSTKDPENIKAILATQFNDFCLGTRHPQLKPLLGDGIFTLDNQGWKESRQ
ncbi:ALK2, partial [Candida margitis]|uniref:ALK2 n=1 Tax=Candida margitis TaxID=1775924 RepID=UPI0022273501